MIADVVDIDAALLAVLDAGEDATDVGFAHGAGTERCRIREQRLQELDRNNLVTLEFNRCRSQHTDILEAVHVHQIALPKGHEEPDTLDIRDILGKGLDLLVVQQVHILVADACEIVLTLDLHGLGLDPVAVLPVGAVGGDFTEVDLRVEVGCERIAVVAAVAVEDVDIVDLVKVVLEGIRREHARYARIEAGAKECSEPCSLEFLLICPLPGIIKVRCEALFLAALLVDGTPLRIIGIFCFIVCSVHVICTAGKAGIHDGQILVGESDIEDGVGLVLVHECGERLEAVCIDRSGGDDRLGGWAELVSERIALGDSAGCDADLGEYRILRTLVDGNSRNTAAADN